MRRLRTYLRVPGWLRRRVPVIIALLSLAVTVGATWQLDATARQRDAARFDAWVEKTHDNAQDRIYNHTNLLRSLLGLFSASQHVTAAEFGRFVDSFDLPQRYPAVKMIGFAVETPTASLPKVRTLLSEQNPSATVWPTTEGPVHYPTVYCHTISPAYEHLLGFDIAADPLGYEAMSRSRKSFAAAATANYLSTPPHDTAAGVHQFALYQPVFREDLRPDRQPADDSHVVGYLYTLINTEVFWRNIFHAVARGYFDISVYNGLEMNQATLEYTNGSPASPRHENRKPLFSKPVTVEIAGRPWTLMFQSRPAFEALSSRSSIVPLTFAAGLLVSGVLFLLARSQTLAWIAAREANAELQRSDQQLREMNSTLEQRVTERTATATRRAVQVRRLASEVTQIEQRERRRLARTLHDHLQQLLVAARFRLQLVNSDGLTEDEVLTLRQELDSLLHEAIDASRSLTIELSPPILHQNGLVDCLQWLARHFHQQHRLDVTLQIDGERSALDAKVNETAKVMLFESVREALLNTVKYAGVTEACIHLTWDEADDMLKLTVTDAGAGFEADKLATRGPEVERFGLFSIRERLELLDGQLHVTSAPGQGTRVTLQLPAHQPTNHLAA